MNYDIEHELEHIEKCFEYKLNEPFIQIGKFKINSMYTAFVAHKTNLIESRLYHMIIDFILKKQVHKEFIFGSFYNNKDIIINAYNIIVYRSFYMIITGSNITVKLYNNKLYNIMGADGRSVDVIGKLTYNFTE